MKRRSRFFATYSMLAQRSRKTKSNVPFNIAALPDLIARAAILAMTSGRASKMMSRTPMGQVILSKVKSSSSSVFRVTLPTISYRAHGSQGPQLPQIWARLSQCSCLTAHTRLRCGTNASIGPTVRLFRIFTQCLGYAGLVLTRIFEISDV